MAIDVSKLLFSVDDDGGVWLCLGDVKVCACEGVERFGPWSRVLIKQIRAIAKEIDETYVPE